MSSLAAQSAAAHKARAGNKRRVSFCEDLQNAGPPADCVGCGVRAKAEPPPPLANLDLPAGVTGTQRPGLAADQAPVSHSDRPTLHTRRAQNTGLRE